VKFVESDGASTHAYCGGPYRGDGRVTVEKNIADCKKHCTALGDACREFRWFDNKNAVTEKDGHPAYDGDGTCYVWSGTCEAVKQADPATPGAFLEVGVIYYKRNAAVERLTPSSAWDYYEALITPVREWGEFEASGLSRAHIGGGLEAAQPNRDYAGTESDGPYCVSAAKSAMVAQDGGQDALYNAGLWPWRQADCYSSSSDASFKFAEKCLPAWWQDPKNPARCRAYNSVGNLGSENLA